VGSAAKFCPDKTVNKAINNLLIPILRSASLKSVLYAISQLVVKNSLFYCQTASKRLSRIKTRDGQGALINF
jgi:hypothetical protein